MLSEKLYPASIDLLYDGMTIPYNIFNSERDLLLIREGKTITTQQIESIKRINKDSSVIYVTAETYKMLIKKSLSKEVNNRDELETAVGYSDVKDETLLILEKAEQSKVLSQDEIYTISDKLTDKIHETKSEVIVELINALAPVDEYLQRHCVNVSLLNGLQAKWMGLPKATVDSLVLIGLLHDCGKSVLPRQILSAPRGVTVTEFEVLKTHPYKTYEIMTEFSEAIRQGSCYHHEKMNGRGYPEGLKGIEIPLFARITAISDIYDAMTARRSYKTPKSPFEIMSLMNELRETDLDPMLLDVFFERMPLELLNKPVMLSDNTVGLVHEIHHDDIKHPSVLIGNKVVKCSDELHCVYMYMDESD